MEGSSKALKKGAWTAEEDTLLRQCIDKYGEGKWNLVPLRAGLNRCRKSCRLRWVNYLNPNINRGEFSSDEVDLLIRLHKLLGNRWSLIAGRLPERTANDVKNYWNTNLARNYRCCASQRNRERPCSYVVPAPKHNVIKPQPRSFSNNIGCSSLINERSEVGIRQVSTKYGSNPSNKGKEKCDLVNNQMDGENMLGKRLLEVSQEEANAVITIDEEGDTSSIDSMSSTFENLESLFNAY